MATLELNQVEKVYPNGYAAIHGINVHIDAGEFVVIVGPSGCGKSTLMRMVAGLESISGGEIKIAGRVVNTLEPAQRNIAMVFQNYALYPHMNVFDNMAYGLKIRKTSKQEIRSRVEEAANILGLSELLQRKPKQLSGGQRQRVAMGRAMVRKPQVFLFDEPLSNLDAKLRVQMRLELQKLHQRFQTTSLYVTHDQVEAMTLADRIIVLNSGHIEQVGTPQQIFDTPASTFVAQFIGAPPMNLIRVQVNEQGQVHGQDGQALTLADNIPQAVYGRSVWMGLRPEHLCLHEQGLPLVIDMIETLGSEQLIHCRFGHEHVVMRCHSRNLGQPVAVGDTLRLWHEPNHTLHWFDTNTGLRIDETTS